MFGIGTNITVMCICNPVTLTDGHGIRKKKKRENIN
jgi:hypothetical protein